MSEDSTFRVGVITSGKLEKRISSYVSKLNSLVYEIVSELEKDGVDVEDATLIVYCVCKTLYEYAKHMVIAVIGDVEKAMYRMGISDIYANTILLEIIRGKWKHTGEGELQRE